MIYFINGQIRLQFSEKSIQENMTTVKEYTFCQGNGKRLAA